MLDTIGEPGRAIHTVTLTIDARQLDGAEPGEVARYALCRLLGLPPHEEHEQISQPDIRYALARLDGGTVRAVAETEYY